MKKIYVLDTNVILDNPDCLIYSFDENDIVIPLTVIEELDMLKKGHGETGYNARQAIRNIEKIRNNKNICTGVVRNELNGILKIVTITTKEKQEYNDVGFNMSKNDDSIILTALKVRKQTPLDIPVILVSNDSAVRIKGSLLDIPSQFYKEGTVPKESIDYTGYNNTQLPLDFFMTKGKFSSKKMPTTITIEEIKKLNENLPTLYPNEFLLLSPINKKDDNGEYILTKKDIKKLKTVYRYSDEILQKKSLLYKNLYGGILGKNLEQSVALDVLMDDSIKVVAISGPSGSGKTLISLSTCLTKLLKEKNNYEKLILLKPTISVSDDIGFLPGNVEEKLNKYMGSYFDNFKTLKKLETVHTKSSSNQNSFEKLKEQGLIEIESISFLRGRSLSDCLIITDEVQNITHDVLKTILTRVGDNCKIILIGDPSQIDRPYLSKYNNGLSYCIDKLKGQNFFAYVKFIHGVRSIVSKKAAELL